MGSMVQPSATAGIDWGHPAGRSRRALLSTTCSTGCGTCFTLTKQPPRFPVRFRVSRDEELEAKASPANVATVPCTDRTVRAKPGQSAGGHIKILARTHRQDVALHQVQRHHRGLPYQDGNDLAPGVWV